MKRSKSVFFLGLLAVCSIIYVGWPTYHLEKFRRILARETAVQSDGGNTAQCVWRVAAKLQVETPTFWQLLQGARPVQVYIHPPTSATYDFGRRRELSAALRYFGSLEGLTITAGCEDVMVLLAGVGRQKDLAKLHCFRVPVTDSVSQVLTAFPGVREMSIESPLFTGYGFPRMPELTIVDLSGSKISAEGLRAIAQCPTLKEIKIADQALQDSGLNSVVEELKGTNPRLIVWGYGE